MKPIVREWLTRIGGALAVFVAILLLSGLVAIALPDDGIRVIFVRTNSALCESTAASPVLELPVEGGYRLNYNPRTREEIETWFATSFSGMSKLETWLRQTYTPRSPGQRPLVIFRPDSSRVREMVWIVRMVNKAGGEVVSPSVFCPTERRPAAAPWVPIGRGYFERPAA